MKKEVSCTKVEKEPQRIIYKRSNAYIINIISQKYFQIYPTVHAHLKMDNVDYLKKPLRIFIFISFLQSIH